MLRFEGWTRKFGTRQFDAFGEVGIADWLENRSFLGIDRNILWNIMLLRICLFRMSKCRSNQPSKVVAKRWRGVRGRNIKTVSDAPFNRHLLRNIVCTPRADCCYQPFNPFGPF